MIILSIDTSQSASVALVDTESGAVLASEQADDQRRHVEFIGPALAGVLSNPVRPELVVTGIGPGPFTGLRVGIAAGIAVGQARGIPVRGLLSQAALAEELRRRSTDVDGPVLVAADARRREVYFSVYESKRRLACRRALRRETRRSRRCPCEQCPRSAETNSQGTSSSGSPALRGFARSFSTPTVLGHSGTRSSSTPVHNTSRSRQRGRLQPVVNSTSRSRNICASPTRNRHRCVTAL